MASIKLLIIASLCYITYALELPSFVTKCKRDDPDLNNCCKKSGNDAIPKICEGVPAFGIPKLDPFEGLTADIETSNLKLHVENLDVSGLKGAKIEEFDMNFDAGDIKLKVSVPKVDLKGNYKVGGRILVVPLSGEGPITLAVDNPVFNVQIKCTFYDKNGEQYTKCNTEKVDFTVESGKVELKNLFGNEDLSRETNKALNQNFPEVMKELGPSISDTVKAIADVIIHKVFEKASVNELFV